LTRDKGCTIWTFDEREGGRLLHVAIIYATQPVEKIVGNPGYPQMAEDLKRTYATLAALPCDILLGAHGFYCDG
jgi:metallo-beta-lactamase class B